MGRRRIDALATLVLEKELRMGGRSYADLEAATGLSKPALMRWVKQMREVNLVHIEGYGPDINGRLFIPLFRWGNGEDAPRPGQARTPAARMADYRARQTQLADQLRGAT